MREILILILFFLCAEVTFGQETNQHSNDFDYHMDKTQELNLVNLFSESIALLKIAIEIAKKSDNNEQFIDATISLGELMRRIQRYKEGLEILRGIFNSEEHHKLHVRRLGRMAAIYAKYGLELEKIDKTIRPVDSIKSYLNGALIIAENNHFKLEATTRMVHRCT